MPTIQINPTQGKRFAASSFSGAGTDWNSIHDIMNTLYNEISLNFPYKNLKLNKVEADDIIAVLCQKYNKEEKILIVSSDKDFQQLQRY